MRNVPKELTISRGGFKLTSLEEMDLKTVYSRSAFSNIILDRGRPLDTALRQDPSAPRPFIEPGGRFYYSEPMISSYVAAYHGKTSDVSEGQRCNEIRTFAWSRLKPILNKIEMDITATAGAVCGVYMLYKDGAVVYIGQSTYVYSRLAHHKGNKNYDSVKLLPCTADRLDDLEGFLIRLIQPDQNGRNTNGEIAAPSSTMWNSLLHTSAV